MDGSDTTEITLAQRQLPKLKSLLKKYRQVKTMQASLLQLSELASTVTDLDDFYCALVDIIDSLLTTNSVHIALANNNNLDIVFCHNPVEHRLVEHVEFTNWRKGLTGLVYLNKAPLHCDAAERKALAKAEKIVLYGSEFIDWLGVPLRRGNQVIGVIALQSYDENLYFDDRDCQLLSFIAEHIVTAIDRVKSRALLEDKIAQRTRKLTDANRRLQLEINERQKIDSVQQVLLSISESVATSKQLAVTFAQVHEHIAKLIPLQNLYIASITENEEKCVYPYYRDNNVVGIGAAKQVESFVALAIKIAKPMLLSKGKLTTLLSNGKKEQGTIDWCEDKKGHPQTWLAAPLMYQGKAIGVIATQRFDHGSFEERHIELFRFVAQQITSVMVRERDLAIVEQSKESLEKLVDERTEALQATNLNLRMQIEERKKAESQLYFEAHHDALTQLPNRAMFNDRLEHALRHIKRHDEHSFAVLFIDLDRFKVINDTLGHHTGDEFLKEIARRLLKCVRDNDVLARLGGDEFVILLDSLNAVDDIEEVTDRIITAISQPFEIDGHCLYSSASIGIALCNPNYQDAGEILRDADAAMYQAKSLGRGRYVFFDDSMREQLLATMTLEQELRVAIKQQQFELHYQQIADLNFSATVGFEALLRWQHPKKGLLTPSEFLFLAEETGMIVEIERWIIAEVGQRLRLWQSEDEYQNALIAINLSGRYLSQPNQLAELMAQITEQQIEPQRLILEFNESAFLQHNELALKGLRKLKEFGVKLALDDYGAGMSSFNFLHSYPFEFIKLDRSFIRAIGSNEKQLSLVKALQELGNNFGYRLVAEGIETEEVLNLLHSVGCNFGQGYHISKPVKLANMATANQDKDQSCA
ncbi:EAL domain-containing protein [Colwellia sp. MEBiC06753]